LNVPVLQIADITGAWGVSFLVMLVNTAIYSLFSNNLKFTGKVKKFSWAALIFFIVLAYGYIKLHDIVPSERGAFIKLSVIQGNIPQELKWDSKARSYILSKYFRLTEMAAAEGPDLIIWPEASSPGLLGQDNEIFDRIYALSKNKKMPLLIGAVASDNNRFFNSALLIDKEGRTRERYDKLHLVPFGEYIPLKNIFPFLETIVPIGDINRGREYTVFQIPIKSQDFFRFSVLICFEDLFPELSRRFVKRGAGFLVNITNDAWYKQTSAPYQHLQASVFRAVENRVFLARAANTGISGFISPAGKIIKLVQDNSGRDIFVDGYATQQVEIPKRALSFYTRHGDSFIFLLLIFTAYSILSFKRPRYVQKT